MKRILLLSFGVLLSAGLGMMVSRYTMAFTTNETVTDRIFEEAGVSQPSDSMDPSVLENLALTEEYPFQNLYLYMYENVLNGPEKAAIKVLSTQYIDGIKFSKNDLEAITQEGSTKEILSRQEERKIAAQSSDELQSQVDDQAAADAEFEAFIAYNEDSFSEATLDYMRSAYETEMRPPVASQEDITTAMTQTAVLGVYNDVMEAYQKELDLQRDNRKLAYQGLANEMFLNNDLTDSANIDLLYDLDLAHYVLFGSYISYPDRSGGEDVDLASLAEAADGIGEPEEAQPTEGPDLAVELSSDSVSPYACLDDTALHDALDAFDSDGSGATAEAPSSTDELSYPDTTEVVGGSITDPENTESATEAAQSVEQQLQDLEPFLTQLAGTKGDWTRSLPCDDVFCITVKLVDENEDPVVSGDYAETDNCVACHIAYINQALTETTDRSMVAGKVSKNWFEDATCKDAGNQVNLDINVYAIKKSIDLDPGDDTDSQPEKDVEDLRTTLLHIGGFPQKNSPETVIGKTPADVECESLLNLNTIAGSPQTLSEVQDQCASASDQLAAELAEVYDQTQMQGLVSDQATLYQQVAAELYKMAVTFRNFQEGIQATYKGDNAPLPSLLAKKYCE